MAEYPESPAGNQEQPSRAGTIFFALWAALLVCITGFALWLSLAGHRPPAAPPTETKALPKLEVGSLVPDFTLRDDEGKPYELREALKQGPVLLVFYLQLSCQHCAAQLQSIGEAQERLAKRQVSIFGISADTPQYTKEALEDFGPLPFPLLADADHHVAQLYGVYQDGPKPVTLHGLFLIGQDSRIRFMDTGEEAYMDVETIENEAARAGTIKNRKPE